MGSFEPIIQSVITHMFYIVMEHTPKAHDCAQKKVPVRMIGLRVSADEYQQCEALAIADQRSVASMARILMQRSLTALREDPEKQA